MTPEAILLMVTRQNVRLVCTFAPNSVFGSCTDNGRALTFSASEALDGDKLRAAARDTDGSFWLVNDKDEVVKVENGKIVRVYNEASGLPKFPLDFVTGAKINLISWDGKDSLWLTDLATMKNELFVKIPDAKQETGDIYPPYESGSGAYQSSFQDSEDNLWIGTLRGGLYRARKQTVKSLSTAEGLTDNNVYPVYEKADGSLLVGTTSGVFKLEDGKFTPVESPKFPIHSFGKDPAGRVVFSCFGDLYAREGNRSHAFFKRENSRTSRSRHDSRDS